MNFISMCVCVCARKGRVSVHFFSFFCSWSVAGFCSLGPGPNNQSQNAQVFKDRAHARPCIRRRCQIAAAGTQLHTSRRVT